MTHALERGRAVADRSTENGVPAPPSPSPAAAAPAAAAVTRSTLVWFGLGFVLLSFFAAFLGSWLARSVDTAAPPASTPTPVASISPDYAAAIEEILPAGSAVRAGSGVPESGKGYEGDVYIDILTADVYLFQDDWTLVGNIRESAAENLTGETGASGETGAQGEQGAQGGEGAQGPSGAPGAPGTQLSLGIGAPVDDTCTTDGDVYIDTDQLAFFECDAGAWVLFGPVEPEPTAEG